MSKPTDVAVIGGGISGLSTAYYLDRQGISVTLFERQSRVGGVIHSERVGDFLLEHGPASILDRDGIPGALVEDLGCGDRVCESSEQSSRRYVLRDGDLRSIPLGPWQALTTRVLSITGKLRVLMEPFISLRLEKEQPEEESVESFFSRRFGTDVHDYLVNPFMGGVFAGSTSRLSAKHATATPYALEQEHGSVTMGLIKRVFRKKKDERRDQESARGLFSFQEGVEELVRKLEEQISGSIQKQTAVHSVSAMDENGSERYDVEYRGNQGESDRMTVDHVVLTGPAAATADLVESADSNLAGLLRDVHYGPLAIVFTGYRDYSGKRELDGFGFLVPEREERSILGTTWNSSLFPGRAPAGGALLTTYVGGARQPELLDRSDAEIEELVQGELRDLLGVTEEPDLLRVLRRENAIPQYNLGYDEVLEAIDQFEEMHPGLWIAGNYRKGVSVPDCVKKGKKLAEKLAS